MTSSLPSITDLKGQAKQLRAQLEVIGTRVSHSKSLELIAHQYGCRDWNTLCASARVRPALPVNVGDRVQGRYLSQPFSGTVVGVHLLKHDRFQIALEFDEAVDVVRSERFSNNRKRVTCTIDSAGITREKTSDGLPHLVLEKQSIAQGAQ
ncbi:hypothetical protein F6455_07060 [Proteobacteria bacterium 005FR1]|nr:hypothetical protein [Proteobacteria bacterium 005FR1]